MEFLAICIIFLVLMVFESSCEFVYRIHYQAEDCKDPTLVHAYQESVQGDCVNFRDKEQTEIYSERYYFDDEGLYVLRFKGTDCVPLNFMSIVDKVKYGCEVDEDKHSIKTIRGDGRLEVGIPTIASVDASFHDCPTGALDCYTTPRMNKLWIDGFEKGYWFYQHHHPEGSCLFNYVKEEDGSEKIYWQIFTCDEEEGVLRATFYSKEGCPSDSAFHTVYVPVGQLLLHPGFEKSPNTFVNNFCSHIPEAHRGVLKEEIESTKFWKRWSKEKGRSLKYNLESTEEL